MAETATEIVVIDKPRALELIEAVVADKGADYVYPKDERPHSTCKYLWNGQPDCLIAHALWMVRPSLDLLDGLDGQGPIVDGRGVLRNYDIEISEEAMQVFWHAQLAQDGGQPFGDALKAAKGELPAPPA